MLFVAFSLIGKPLTIAPDIIPCIGRFYSNLAGCFVFAVSFFAALSLSFAVTALAWIYYRPLLGSILLALSFAVVSARSRRSGRRAAAAATRRVGGVWWP